MFRVLVMDVAAARPIFDDLASRVTIPGSDGELSVLDFHQSMVACLKEGEIRIDRHKPIAIKKGIARTEKNKMAIIIEK